MNQQDALKNLVDARDVLKSFGLTHFLIDGTLLGAIREHNFIEHDDDTDMGVMAKEWNIEMLGEVVKAMMRKGFILYHSFGSWGECFEVAWRRNSIKLDFFFYWEKDDKMVFHAFDNGGRNLPADIITYEYPKEMIRSLTEINFLGENFAVPQDYLGVLETKYGPNWHIPVKKWDWRFGPNNVVKK